jgi:hypothetical protein
MMGPLPLLHLQEHGGRIVDQQHFERTQAPCRDRHVVPPRVLGNPPVHDHRDVSGLTHTHFR